MRVRTFGRLGWQVSEIGHGLWGVGGWTGSDDAESVQTIRHSAASGCTFFDTALAYGEGKSERLLAQALRQQAVDKNGIEIGTQFNELSPDLNSLRIATKVPPKNRKWPASASDPLDEVFPADHIRACTETSLDNLGRQTVDLQQFHVWSDTWAEDEGWQRAVSDLKSQGLIRAMGISVNRWQPTNVVKALRTGLIDSVQVVYNIFDQDAADELFPICQDLGVAVIVRVPFDEGSLADALQPGQTWPDGDWRNIYFAPDKLKETLRRVALLKEDLPPGMSLAQLALRFILSHPAVTTIIPGMRRARHVDANFAASDGQLLPSQLLTRLRRHRWDRGYAVP